MFLVFIFSSICFAAILFFGPYGIIFTTVAIYIFKKIIHPNNTILIKYRNPETTCKKIAIFLVITYAILIPFNSILESSSTLYRIAEIQCIKFPHTKEFMAVYSDGSVYSDYFIWLRDRSFLRNLLFSFSGSVFLTFLILVYVVTIKTFTIVSSASSNEFNKNRLTTPIFLAFFFILILMLSSDYMYLSSSRVDIWTPLILPLLIAYWGIYTASAAAPK